MTFNFGDIEFKKKLFFSNLENGSNYSLDLLCVTGLTFSDLKILVPSMAYRWLLKSGFLTLKSVVSNYSCKKKINVTSLDIACHVIVLKSLKSHKTRKY